MSLNQHFKLNKEEGGFSRNEPSSFPTQLTYPDSDHDDEVKDEDIIMIDIQREISRFYNTYLNLSDSLDPLEFYRENKDIYPHLANLTRMLFSIPASSVPFEYLFSKAADITTIEIA